MEVCLNLSFYSQQKLEENILVLIITNKNEDFFSKTMPCEYDNECYCMYATSIKTFDCRVLKGRPTIWTDV